MLLLFKPYLYSPTCQSQPVHLLYIRCWDPEILAILPYKVYGPIRNLSTLVIHIALPCSLQQKLMTRFITKATGISYIDSKCHIREINYVHC